MAGAKRAKVLASALGKQLPSNFGQFLSLPRLAIFCWMLLNIMYSLRKDLVMLTWATATQLLLDWW